MNCILVRHAHADLPDHKGADFDRPLSSQGLLEARASARAIVAAGYRPTLLLASPACRTRQTAAILAQEFGLGEGDVHLLDSLYNATAATLAAALLEAANGESLVVLVAHNPGISDLARDLSGNPLLPSCKPAEWRVASLPTNGAQ